MSYLIDTHCHLQDREFFTAKQAEEMIARAHDNNVQRIICIGTDTIDSLVARDFAKAHPNVYWTYGVHPEEAVKYLAGTINATEAVNKMRDGLEENKDMPVAIGEVGLDYHTEGYDRDAQIKVFEEMLQIATDCLLPVSFHIRNAYSDFFPVVANFPAVRGVVHCFTDSRKSMKRILEETNFYVGVNGIMTYSTLADVPLERAVFETDAPFLAPVPHRGLINEPAYIKNIAEWYSEKYKLPFDLVAHTTSKNAEDLFLFKDRVAIA